LEFLWDLIIAELDETTQWSNQLLKTCLTACLFPEDLFAGNPAVVVDELYPVL
jgi:hypothetical protein